MRPPIHKRQSTRTTSGRALTHLIHDPVVLYVRLNIRLVIIILRIVNRKWRALHERRRVRRGMEHAWHRHRRELRGRRGGHLGLVRAQG